jgi:hypothetical protein
MDANWMIAVAGFGGASITGGRIRGPYYEKELINRYNYYSTYINV